MLPGEIWNFGLSIFLNTTNRTKSKVNGKKVLGMSQRGGYVPLTRVDFWRGAVF
jgi:hypothetical protein